MACGWALVIVLLQAQLGLAAVARARALQPSPPAPTTNLTCDTCIFIAGVVQEISENATTVAALLSTLDEACSVIGDPTVTALCDVLMSGLTSLLPFLDEQMRTLAWDIPITFCSVIFPVCEQPCCDASAPLAPEQLHLALTGRAGEMVATWVTLNATAASVARWGPAGGGAFPSSAVGSARTYRNGGWVGIIHEATLTGLAAGARFDYEVGDGAGAWSATRSFATLPADVGSAARPLRVAQIGDMAYDVNSDNTVARIAALVEAGQVDMVLHIGDISYADGEQRHWDMFMRKIEPIASAVPYMVCRGNHELWWNFTAITARFSMPHPLYYSLDVGPLHVVMFNTETPDDTGSVDAAEVSFLDADLAAANASRAVTPWLVAGAHRPLYCTNGLWKSSDKDCALFAGVMRGQAEATLARHGVDLVLGAHMHGFERTQAVFAGKVVSNATNGSSTYVAAGAPVYVVNGAGGNREGNDDPNGDAPWSVVGAHFRTIGFGLLTVTQSQMQYEFVESATGNVLDTAVWVH